MKILFIGQIIPQKLLENNYGKLKRMNDPAANAFYNALLNGLSSNQHDVEAIAMIDDSLLNQTEKNIHGVTYSYVNFDRNVIFRSLKSLFRTFFYTNKWRKKNKTEEKCVIFNCLRISQSIGSLIVCKLFGLKTIGVVTDVPGFRVKKDKTTLVKKLSNFLGTKIIKMFDGYILLSEDMKDIISDKKIKYCLIEGMYLPDSEILEEPQRYDNYTVLYAGALMRQYNIMNLIEAVRQIDDPNLRLNLYGTGDLVEEIKSISAEDNRVQYQGTAPRTEILRQELKSHLLVNPRLSTESYTKYSFPSKNIEYMASGTPVLFTKLPSMPEEYYSYINLIEDETADGIKAAILKVMGDKDVYQKADNAREFIYNQKNPQKQTLKITALLELL